ncbi:30S ribosomal protein S3 [Candidatus Falkowbacteria bacterium]|jgi:small subunit ribosomal protein S3|nr:30S ribosomal protein S3 [Candidatus Falkowbacteria bacterium]MBT4433000.1 30S ribosomal protein S3 [Candidatus Falkowbacteria bacterium]
MGQKVHPKSFRLNSIYNWGSSWFSEKKFGKFLREDILIKEYIKKKLKNMGIAEVNVKRSGESFEIDIYSSKPGMIIGRGGSGIETLQNDIMKDFFKEYNNKKVKPSINLNIKEVKNINLTAELVAENIVTDIEKRVPFRKVIKQVAGRVKKAGAKGVKIMVAGRLNGAEIARSEHVSEGNLPLHTLRADIDYASKPANTIYGVIGVKVWIYKGEIFDKKNNKIKDNKVL